MKDSFSVLRLVTDKSKPGLLNPELGSMDLIPKVAKFLHGKHFDVLQTPGGYFNVGYDLKDAGRGIYSEGNFEVATELVKQAVHEGFISQLNAVGDTADYVTLGVDVLDTSSNVVGVETVVTYNVREKRIEHVTGKSYPTPDQVNSLIYCLDFNSHFQLLNGHRVMVLGCHDLSMFMNRSIANMLRGRGDSYKSYVAENMNRIMSEFKPDVVLQHPHTTVLTATWRAKWSGLMEHYPSIKTYASGIHYFDNYTHPDPNKWSSLEDVLRSTKQGNITSVLCGSEGCRLIDA